MKKSPQKELLLGYMDESGEPGSAKNNHDYFVVCIVIINTKATAKKVSSKIDQFRHEQNLPNDYEFHYVDNHKKVRANFIDLISKLNFNFISVSIKKNNLRHHASCPKMAQEILKILEKHQLNISIEMDKNPRLYKELRNKKRDYTTLAHCSEKNSRGHNLIQLTDYVTALRTRFLKYPHKAATKEAYKSISDKLIYQINL